MKIEIGESLFYSWLRHVKKCHIVQTNWKVSPQWKLTDSELIEKLMNEIDNFFFNKYNYSIFKQNKSLSQLLQQGECDVLGISIQSDNLKYYAIDVAFHEAGLNYGSKNVTIMKVLEKLARIAFCLHGYILTKDAEIIFASPKINHSVLSELTLCIEDLNNLFIQHNYNFNFRLISNDDYNNIVLQPILSASNEIADTSELFLRSYQMYKMFSYNNEINQPKIITINNKIESNNKNFNINSYQQQKIGQLAQQVLRKILCNDRISDTEIEAMQTKEYSKKVFNLNFPLLRLVIESKKPDRYYKDPLTIKNKRYWMCSEWYEHCRYYLEKWIKLHE